VVASRSILRIDRNAAPDMTDILFVCLGNICRSPLMEGIARARFQAPPGADPITFDSAGIGDWHAGRPPDPRAVAAAARRGVDISGQRARVFDDGDFNRFDLILCADQSILDVLRRRLPSDARAECALFLDWTGASQGGEVPDPYTGTSSDFDAVFVLIDSGVTGLADRLLRL
jgi:protein-tyrosine phosphatase